MILCLFLVAVSGRSHLQVRNALEANKTYGESLDRLALFFYYNLLLEPFLSARHILVPM
jgi:hypothetical protein